MPRWKRHEEDKLIELCRQGLDRHHIAQALGKSLHAVDSKLRREASNPEFPAYAPDVDQDPPPSTPPS